MIMAGETSQVPTEPVFPDKTEEVPKTPWEATKGMEHMDKMILGISESNRRGPVIRTGKYGLIQLLVRLGMLQDFECVHQSEKISGERDRNHKIILDALLVNIIFQNVAFDMK